jgi:hypothetical protein
MPTLFPYPGLRPFQIYETDIFFGREIQTDDLLRKLSKSRFLGVIGPSGCGKSSLVRAGMISALETGFMVQAGAHWIIAEMRPGSHPLKRLSGSLMNSVVFREKNCDPHAFPFLEATLRRGPLGLINILQENPLSSGTNLLLLVDQFEEMFRFRNDENRDEQDAFVALLLETVSQPDVPVYVVITMRSDFIGDCAIFPGLPEALNASQYLTPRLNREQRYSVIVGPAKVFGGEIEPSLVNRLLNETGDDPNQLPILQHILMRMWACTPPGKAAPNAASFFCEVPAETMGHKLTELDYERIGGLKEALSRHADEAFESLSENQKAIAEILFKSLCEHGAGRRDGRLPTALSEISFRAGVSEDNVIEVVEVFRNSNYGFITPALPEPIYTNTLLDITHESLIRLWKRLSIWTKQEAEYAKQYRLIVETSRRWKAGQAALWGTPDLEQALEWKRLTNPNDGYAKRYLSDSENITTEEQRVEKAKLELSIVIEFLDNSQKEQRRREVEVRKEQTKKLRRARYLAVSFATLAIILAFGILLYSYLLVWDHVAYYADFNKLGKKPIWVTNKTYVKGQSWIGEPRGIGELSDKQVKSRPVSIKIIRKGLLGHVVRMETVNSRHETTHLHSIGTYLEPKEKYKQKEVAWEFNYDSAGRVSYEEAFDSRGKLLGGFIYLPSMPGQDNIRTGYYINPAGFPRAEDKYSQSAVEIEYKEVAGGFQEYRRYRNRSGIAARGPDKAFGQLRTYNDNGRLTLLTSLGPNDKPMDDEVGNASLVVSKWDSFGNSLKAVALNAAGEITTVTEGWSSAESGTDSSGNAIWQAYFEKNDKPTLHEKGYHKIWWKLDTNGNKTKEWYTDLDGHPTVGDTGCHILFSRYNERNNQIQESCADANGNPVENISGYSFFKAEYDEINNLINYKFFDIEGKPISSIDGFAVCNISYDEIGRPKMTNFFDSKGDPVLISRGYSSFHDEFDENNHLKSASYFGIDKKPIITNKGYFKWKQDFDQHGNWIRVNYFGTDDKLIINKEGIAGKIAKYDASGNQIEEVNLNSNNEPIIGKNGYAGWRAEYDKAGNVIQKLYIGTKGECVFTEDGVSGYESDYDHLGNETQRRYFDLDRKPTRHQEGYAGWTAKYDARSNLILKQYFDINQKPTLISFINSGNIDLSGYFRKTQEYNSQNKLALEAYWGVYGEAVVNEQGWAKALHFYDSRGNPVKSSYYDRNEKPVVLNNIGYHLVERKYNNKGNLLEQKYFDGKITPVAISQGYARVEYRYDRFGREIERLHYDINGKEAYDSINGIHKAKTQYNSYGKKILVSYFSDAGPMLHQDGYHEIHYNYDDRGNQIETSFHGVKGEAVLNDSKEYSILRIKYDDHDNPVENRYFDVSGKPKANDIGCSIERFAYDPFGNNIEVLCLNHDEKLTLTHSGYAGFRSKYNNLGKVIFQEFLDADMKPSMLSTSDANNDRGYAILRAEYDVYGNQIEVAYFGNNDNPILIAAYGYHSLSTRFNNRRQIIEQTTYDIEKKPILNKHGYAKLQYQYDERGHLIEQKTFDERDQPYEGELGYAQIKFKYDDYGNKIEEACFGANGMLKQPAGYKHARIEYDYDSDGNLLNEYYFDSKGKLIDIY